VWRLHHDPAVKVAAGVLAKDSTSEDGNRRFRLLAENVPAGLLVYTAPEGTVAYCNRAAARILGTSPESLAGTTGVLPGWILLGADSAPLPPELHPVQVALRTGEEQDGVIVGIRGVRVGPPTWLIMSVAFDAAQGSVSEVFCTFSDFTGHRLAEEQLADLQNFNQHVLEHLPAQLAVYDPDGRIVYVNPAAVSDPEQRRRIAGLTDLEYFEDRPEWHDVARRRAEAVAQCVRDRRVVTMEEEDPRGIRHTRFYLRFFSPVIDAYGAVVRVLSYGLDITARRRAEEERWLAEIKYRRLVERMPLITYVAALDNRRTPSYVNPQLEVTLGFKREEWLRNPNLWMERIHPDDRDRVAEEINMISSTGSHFRCEYRMIAADGRVLWFADEAVAARDEGGRARTIQGFLLDITERKLAQETIARLAAIVESSDDGIYSRGVDGMVITCNQGIERVYGFRPREVIGENVSTFIPEAALDEERRAVEQVLREGRTLRYEAVHRHKDGRDIQVAVTMSPLRGHRGSVSGVAVIARDITELKDLENQLRQSQKMEAIGQLAGGVAHDFNNLLTAITGYTELLLEEAEPGSLLRQDLEEIARASDRAAWLTRQLLAFSRRQMMAPEVINVNRIVENMEKLLRRLIGENIHLGTRLARDIGLVRADPVQIEQVLMNLAVNARDAMPDGGDLRIETMNAEMDEALASKYVSVQPGPCVLITVSDSGCGMDEQTRLRAFEPFFTTKERGKGTGLGLSTVYGIVKQSGGSIWVTSEVGRGTTFLIYLPRTAAGEDDAPAKGQSAPSAPGAGTVLLVEDEDVVRSFARQVLTRQGYHVLAARDGSEALLLSDGYAGPIRLLLADVMMPKMSGTELAEILVQRRPAMRLLFMSGYSDSAMDESGIFAGGRALLHKPFKPDELAERVRQALED
jgi:PAS domain S-box-containing protein